MDRIFIILLLLYLLLIIILQNPLFEHNSQSNSNPITIVSDMIGPISYENGILKIQYIGYPYVPFT